MLFEENNQTTAANVSATDTEGLIGTAGSEVFLQPLLNAIMEAVFEKRELTSADDLDDILETGIYEVATAPRNSPEGSAYYTLLVGTRNAGDVRQIAFTSPGGTSGAMYVRSRGGSPTSWRPWYKFIGAKNGHVSAVAFNHRVDRNWDGLGVLTTNATDVTADFDSGVLSQKIAACNFDDYDLGMQIKKTITIDGTARVAHIIFAHANAFFGYDSRAMVNTPNIACVVYVEGLTGKWNASNTDGGYVSSNLRVEVQKVVTALKSVLGESHMVPHSVLLSNATSGGKSSGWTWVTDSYGEAMSAAQMCGTEISGSYFDTGEAFEQLALFREVRPNQVGGDSYYPWLRDVLTALLLALLTNYGSLGSGGVTNASSISLLILLK